MARRSVGGGSPYDRLYQEFPVPFGALNPLDQVRNGYSNSGKDVQQFVAGFREQVPGQTPEGAR